MFVVASTMAVVVAAFASVASPARAVTVIVVDNRTPGRFDAAASWGTSSWRRSGFGRDYRFARPTTRPNTALFRIPLRTRGLYRVSAWWPADRGYGAAVPFVLRTSDGVRVVRVDQRRHGGRWVELGRYSFAAGDEWIVGVAAPTRGTGVAIADAVRFELIGTRSRTVSGTLAVGSRGAAVHALQERLVELGYLSPAGESGIYRQTTWHAVVAFQGWHGLRRDGIAGPATRGALASAGRPQPWGGLSRGLQIDLDRQALLVVAGGRVQRAIHVSTAAPGYRTPTGSYRIYRRELRSWSWQYQVWLPYALYFTGGYALHAYPSVPEFPASHGCVRLPAFEATAVYAATPLETAVIVR
jgi:hypothetical protein